MSNNVKCLECYIYPNIFPLSEFIFTKWEYTDYYQLFCFRTSRHANSQRRVLWRLYPCRKRLRLDDLRFSVVFIRDNETLKQCRKGILANELIQKIRIKKLCTVS